ncbi:NADH:ubiquinone oxidoreductase, membrane subunit L [Candidatus Sulfotelmatomonas gaucii]|uniref:NADH:ubiquinone oxidoreductase, membrane subunit L n=1 Tax=Candidatus Sulfuritelmatomonas gaucii TaxID=2043161 RepID=A0A2N9LSR5_9BACT|nr:NADH:ubiquinone oxidoreductase, membrane subunit L [Candidatus Sulfotelmatomonas gaucii]
MNESLHLWLIPLLPFVGFVLNGILGSRLPRRLVTAIGLLAPLGSLALVFNAAAATMISAATVCQGCGRVTAVTLPYGEICPFPWLTAGAIHVDFSFVLDQLSLVMLLVVTGVGFLIHVYSIGYMKEDKSYARFFSFLNLFLFFMTVLVLAGNFLVMFVGWEGVGLASYLLIGFWFEKNTAAEAGKKAFIVNRIGDFGFLIGIFLLISNFGTLAFQQIRIELGMSTSWHGGVLTVICLCLLLGAAGKSAQLPLYVWLPDAMEGPTPVSALIHAATMVTAGVYMIARTHFLFDRSPFALATVAIVGAATALFAATMGLAQNDIKRVLAYSTISQLGYMFLACGVAAYSAAIFHLFTHAFFKALLFLAAGSVIHALGGEQDMRNMGGLRKKLPVTFWTMTAAVFAISGFPPFAGFFSKDAILYAAFLQGTLGKILWFVGLLTALITALYMFRLWYMTFFGEPRTSDAHPHESPWSMRGPMVILGLLCVCGGWIGIDRFTEYLAPSVGLHRTISSGSIGLELVLSLVAVLVALEGWLIAGKYYRRKPERPAEFAAAMPTAYKILLNNYYVDEIYGAVIVKPLLILSRFVLGGIEFLLAGVAWLLGGIAMLSGMILQRWQSGNLRSYAAWLALGAAALLLFMVVPSLLAANGIDIRWTWGLR